LLEQQPPAIVTANRNFQESTANSR